MATADTIDAMLKAISIHNDELNVDLWYPGQPGMPKHLVLGLVDVRAADPIRISYDKRRDGWKIEQSSIFQWKLNDKVCDPGWQEVAFVQAWGSEAGEVSKDCDRCGWAASCGFLYCPYCGISLTEEEE